MIENWVKELSFGEVQNDKNFSITPIISNFPSDLNFITLRLAMEKKRVKVKEVDARGSVPEITVQNLADEYLLIIDGEHLVGAKQNRIVNKTIIIPPKSDVFIPVTCTEEGRWHFESNEFRKSHYSAPSTFRSAFKMKDSAQGEVWAEVRHRVSSYGVSTDTSSLEDVYNKVDSSLSDYKKEITFVPNQIGFIAFINDEFAGLDIVNDSGLFSELYDDMLSGYLIDALDKHDGRKRKGRSENLRNQIFNEISKSKRSYAKRIGVETRSSIRGENVAGELVSFNRKPVHIAVFPIN